MTNATHDRMHELLCAYVLGEATADERAEVERALASSPELQREKERIEATIGLVQSAISKDDALSSARREDVLRAALPPVTRPWWKETWVRAAAGILFVSFALGGWSIYEQTQRAQDACEVAQVEASQEPARGQDVAGQPLASAQHDGTTKKDTTSGFVAGVPAEGWKGGPGDQRIEAKFGAAAAQGALQPGAPVAGSTQATGLAPAQGQAEFWDRMTRNPGGGGGGEALKLASGSAGPSTGGAATPGAADPPIAGRSESDQKVTDYLYYDGGSTGGLGAAPAPAPTAGLAAGEKAKQDDARGKARMGAAGDDAYLGSGGGGAAGRAPLEEQLNRVLVVQSNPVEQLIAGSGAAAGQKKAPAGAAPTVAGSPESERLAKLRAPSEGKTRVPALQPASKDLTVALPKDTESELVLFDADTGGSGESLGLRGLDVPSARASLEGMGYLGGEDDHGRALSDEDRFVLQKLGIQPGQPLPPITLELRLKYRDEYVDHWCQRIRRHCERRPDERPRDMFFRFWGDNPFELTALDPLSTFSADVDTASYVLARRYIKEGHIPEKAQVRTEEFVNYFKADVPPPAQGTFAITTTLAPSRYGATAPGEVTSSGRDLLRVTIRGKDVPKAERKPLALTFVVDCSGSMKEQNRIEMVKHAMRLLVSQLDARDSIAIVKFSTDATTVLPMTSAGEKGKIESAIFPLAAEGSTNSEAGLRMGYAAALGGLNVEATNRVVFLSDGVANVGVVDPNVIAEGVKAIREKGIYLNTIGVGMNNHNDVLLEQLADKGDGVCNYVDGPEEAKKVFVDQFMGAVETIARDVKLQVEFDPAQVFRYRLLGYENRAVADADFRNDKVDAGEVGAGHQVTALYEIEYANPSAASEKPLATVRVRWKQPRNPNAPTANEEASEIAQNVTVAQRTSWEGAGPGYRRAAIVAQFAEFLRRSIHARNDSFDELVKDAKRLESETRDPEFSEFVTLLDQSKALILNGWPNREELALAIDQIRENCVLRAQLERLASERDKDVLAELERSNREMEARLREMLRRRLEQPR